MCSQISDQQCQCACAYVFINFYKSLFRLNFIILIFYNMEEEILSKVMWQIFSNWTALKLAVEHSMAGPNSRQVAVDCVNYMIRYCLSEENVQKEDIEEALEDLLDQEFETICEDNSPREIATILDKFLRLLKEGNIAQCEQEYNNLPTSQEGWLINSKPQPNLTAPVPDKSSESEHEDNGGAGTSNDVEMTEHSDWTQVKSRRKR